MASISREKNGHKTIQFYGADQKRRSIRLGKMSMTAANSIKSKIEHLVSHSITKHALDNATSIWLSELDIKMTKKLVRAGLVEEQETMSLEELIDYFLTNNKRKESTLKKYKSTKNYLYEYFGKDRLVNSISVDNADKWAVWISERECVNAENTIRKHCGVVSVFFNYAVKKKRIRENPFGDLVSTTMANKSRDYYISKEDAEKVLQACPDAEWRLIFALARYGGLRTPSETFALQWDDINWSDDRFYIRSPKTEHHEGKEGRIVPLFPEIRPYLEECFEQAADGSEYVIVKHRVKSGNLRTTLKKIVTRAGLNPWPKPFQNLRSTRETELQSEGFNLQTVVAWLGNSPEVALKSYLQVREEDFQKALRNPVRYFAPKRNIVSQTENMKNTKSV